MAKKKTVNNLDLYTMKMDDLVKCLKPWELAVLLQIEPFQTSTDILLDNMMYYFLQNEYYEYCVIVRDEVESRKITK